MISLFVMLKIFVLVTARARLFLALLVIIFSPPQKSPFEITCFFDDLSLYSKKDNSVILKSDSFTVDFDSFDSGFEPPGTSRNT